MNQRLDPMILVDLFTLSIFYDSVNTLVSSYLSKIFQHRQAHTVNLFSSDYFNLDKSDILKVCFPVVKPRVMAKTMFIRFCNEEEYTHVCEGERELTLKPLVPGNKEDVTESCRARI